MSLDEDHQNGQSCQDSSVGSFDNTGCCSREWQRRARRNTAYVNSTWDTAWEYERVREKCGGRGRGRGRGNSPRRNSPRR